MLTQFVHFACAEVNELRLVIQSIAVYCHTPSKYPTRHKHTACLQPRTHEVTELSRRGGLLFAWSVISFLSLAIIVVTFKQNSQTKGDHSPLESNGVQLLFW